MSTPATPPRLPPTPHSASTPRTPVTDQPQSPSTPKSASKRRLPKISLPSLSNFSLSSSPDTRVTLPPSPSSSGSTRRRKESGSSESEVSTTSVDLSDTPKPNHGAIEYPAIPSPRQDQPSRLSLASSQRDGLKYHGTESPSRNPVQNGMGRSRSLRTPTFMAPEEPLGRSTSIRSNRSSISISAALPSPLADFQSDNVLNASHRRVQYAHVSPHIQPSSAGPSSPVSRPMTAGRSSTSLQSLPPSHERYRLDLKDGHGVQNGGAAAVRSDTQVRGARTPTYAGNWNPFIPPGLDGWTRETWATRKVALISGITGQDGSYLTELLLSKGYTVHGIIRRSSSFNTSRLHHLYSDSHESEGEEERGRMILHYGDLTDTTNLVYIISQVQPSEIYNLGAQSHVKVSFEMAEYTGDVDGLGTLRLLDAVRTCGLDKLVKFYQASTSELYGKVREIPQNEDTPFYPRSPYGVAKLYAYWTVVNYREAYGIFAANGILFNHESPRRGRTFVTRKITRAVAEISLGKQDCMFMGNLDALRDWGHARDYVEGMWRILQHDEPRDFVLASGENHSVREFIEKSFAVVGVEIAWSGEGVDEVGVCKDSGRIVVRVDPRYFRPAEVEQLLGDPSLAEKLLGWSRQVSFDELVREMVESDVASAKYLVEDHN